LKARHFHLPGGVRVTLGDGTLREEATGLFAEELRGIRALFTDARGLPIPLEDLPLASLHTFRAILRRLRQVPERPVPLECDNCGASNVVLPSSTLELGPYVDDELEDPELDAPFDFLRAYEVPGLGLVRLAPRTARQAGPLFESLARPGPVRVTSRFVEGMGLVSIGEISDPRRIARRLQRAPEETFEALVTLFERAHTPPRLDTPHRCTGCGVTLWCPAPAEREFSAPPDARSGGPDAEGPSDTDDPPDVVDHGPEGPRHAFIDLDAFEARVRRIAKRVYRGLGVRQVHLEIEAGPAETDEGGHPLLGSYTPGDPNALIPSAPEIKLYYRSFANQYRDVPYDIDAEIEETLRHELEHHLAFLAGDDPVDRAERAALVGETLRRAGTRATARRQVRESARSLREFLQATWWIWVLAVLGVAYYFVDND
jgi:hypothetical protein